MGLSIINIPHCLLHEGKKSQVGYSVIFKLLCITLKEGNKIFLNVGVV